MSKYRFFYLKQNGRIVGPLTAAVLRQFFESGKLTSADEISPDKARWRNAGEFFSRSTGRGKVTVDISGAVLNEQLRVREAEQPPPTAVVRRDDAEYVRRRPFSWKVYWGIFLTMFCLFAASAAVVGLCRYSRDGGDSYETAESIDPGSEDTDGSADTADDDNGNDDTGDEDADSSEVKK